MKKHNLIRGIGSSLVQGIKNFVPFFHQLYYDTKKALGMPTHWASIFAQRAHTSNTGFLDDTNEWTHLNNTGEILANQYLKATSHQPYQKVTTNVKGLTEIIGDQPTKLKNLPAGRKLYNHLQELEGTSRPKPRRTYEYELAV